ncbi:metallophosphoesterase [Thiocapsa roseopersicina]|uniref:Calcineurin-like phosphoesterase n=1 Tax=Thiocapsa roseopersicina TaxID=1058 RepID=A0A1H2TV70_THIRO|nr:metallophosphoesterase [Thiocapsa roseopersicina]SDW47658.1 Calcineurin-like phosphoesterase [Thiocapsa roseopersicina]
MYRHPKQLGVWPVALLVLLSAASARAEPLRFFAAGDLPYFSAETEQLRELFDTAEAEGTPLLIHVGDIKSGSSPCTDANLEAIADLFRARAVPVVFTPGDNEWTDCNRERAGAKDPRERLARVREIFYGDPGVLRLDRLGAFRGEGADATDYPENYTFIRDGVLFVSVHVVGSNNGYAPDDPAAVAEFEARDVANVHFLRQATALAAERDASAMVIVFHSNPQFEKARPARGFVRLRRALVELMGAYPGPVLAIHGDTHRFKHDRPLIDPATGAPFRRFVRTEVPGSPVVGGVWISVDAQAEEPFGVSEMYPISRDRLIQE